MTIEFGRSDGPAARMTERGRGGVVLLAAMLLAAALVVACQRDPALEATVEVVESDAPVAVEIETAHDVQRVRAHNVRLTWLGEEDAILSGARFLHYVSSDGQNRVSVGTQGVGSSRTFAPNDPGALYIAAHDCRWVWDRDEEQPVDHCWDAPSPMHMVPGDSHVYLVRVLHPGPMPWGLDPGTYVVEEAIDWWFVSNQREPDLESEPDGTFTIRLTYEAR